MIVVKFDHIIEFPFNFFSQAHLTMNMFINRVNLKLLLNFFDNHPLGQAFKQEILN